MTLTSNALKEQLKKLRKNKVLSPLAFLGKKYIYNPYIKLRITASNFPPEIWIENTNCCNAECVMCPRDKHTRPLGFMPFSLFEKLIEEISEHKETVKRVHLHNYGEPLLDRELSRRIKLAKDYGIRHTYFVTNASLLSKEKSREIIEAGLDEFKVSFYGTDKKTYNDTMEGLDFEKTLKNLKNFFKVRDEIGRGKPNVIVQYLPIEANRTNINEFFRIIKPLINEDIGDSLNIFSLHNYGDGRSYIALDKIVSICDYPWRTMTILNDGRVVICCIDFNGAQVIDDVNKRTIKEIWNSEQYKKVRNDFKNLRYNDYPICTKCNIIR